MASKPEDDTSIANNSCFFQRPKSLPLPKSVTRIVNRESITKCSNEKRRSQSLTECDYIIPPKNEDTVVKENEVAQCSSKETLQAPISTTGDSEGRLSVVNSDDGLKESDSKTCNDQENGKTFFSSTENVDSLRDVIKKNKHIIEPFLEELQNEESLNQERNHVQFYSGHSTTNISPARSRRENSNLTLDPSKLAGSLRQINPTIEAGNGGIIDSEDSINSDIENSPSSGSLPFPTGKQIYKACEVCCEYDFIHERFCCQSAICNACMETYVATKVTLGIVRIMCPSGKCDNKYVVKDEIAYRLPVELKTKYHKFLVDQNRSPYEKTCPNCSLITNMVEHRVKFAPKKGLNVVCQDCDFKWCFICQGPSHERLTCKQTVKGDTLMRKWAKQVGSALVDRPNAVKCPKCRAYIQKSSGCDHMQCNRCNTDFCYRCGERLLSLKGFGDHYSKYSILGCKYRYYPNKPGRRRFVRGSILSLKLLAAPIAGAGIAVCAGVVAVGALIFFLPCWSVHKCWKKTRRS
ncbi:DgyrCDS3956 [Dimorphilus gyrociliatus]|uniref:RBR-type E3 ubiquitin transferase n=1 Tax=Dimorphilus gyrociliatus TaxID=2664684 RepID=A0A7I8VF72_9ANNE|nr:DgyrCDS3956 [Dimorphilus gyrociliatus]